MSVDQYQKKVGMMNLEKLIEEREGKDRYIVLNNFIQAQ